MDNPEPKHVLFVANYGNVAHRLLYPGDTARRARVMCGYATRFNWERTYIDVADGEACQRCERMYRLYGPGSTTDSADSARKE